MKNPSIFVLLLFGSLGLASSSAQENQSVTSRTAKPDGKGCNLDFIDTKTMVWPWSAAALTANPDYRGVQVAEFALRKRVVTRRDLIGDQCSLIFLSDTERVSVRHVYAYSLGGSIFGYGLDFVRLAPMPDGTWLECACASEVFLTDAAGDGKFVAGSGLIAPAVPGWLRHAIPPLQPLLPPTPRPQVRLEPAAPQPGP